MSYIKSFLAFWQDLLIGDAVEVAVGVVIVLVAAKLLIGVNPALDEPLGPAITVAVAGVLGGSLWWERRKG